MIVDPITKTAVDEVAGGIYRIHVPLELPGGGFSFNQYLVRDEEPLLFHTGPRKTFPLVRAAIEKVIPLPTLRWIGFSHVESDECGSMNELLALAPRARPVASRVAAMTSGDLFDRDVRVLADGETMRTGVRTLRWLDVPHLPHNWETGYLFDEHSRTLLCGDLFTQPGAHTPPVVETDILGPSEAFRREAGDYFAHAQDTRSMIERFATLNASTLACMHGSAWRGDSAKLLRELASAVESWSGPAVR